MAHPKAAVRNGTRLIAGVWQATSEAASINTFPSIDPATGDAGYPYLNINHTGEANDENRSFFVTGRDSPDCLRSTNHPFQQGAINAE